MNIRILIGVLFCGALTHQATAQNHSKPEVWGYVSDMVSGITQNVTDDWHWQNTIHNRLNFNWQPGEYWYIDASMRNRMFFGAFLEYSFYRDGYAEDYGIADLSWNLVDDNDAVLNVSFDRLAVTFEKNKWSLKLGRQRINWGQTFVWYPNDLFNSYSFFDFDYIERPGCDAFRCTYYHNETSFSELVVSADKDYDITAALLHHGTIKGFDYQVMAGIQSSDELVAGGAWTGDIKGYNLRGEFAYHQPLEEFFDSRGFFEISVGADHLFNIGEKSLMAQCEVMWNNKKSLFDLDNILEVLDFYNSSSSANIMSVMNKWNCVGMVSYPATERLSLSASGMYMSGLKGAYGGLTVSYSLGNNMDFSFISQYFSNNHELLTMNIHAWFGFARLKFSF